MGRRIAPRSGLLVTFVGLAIKGIWFLLDALGNIDTAASATAPNSWLMRALGWVWMNLGDIFVFLGAGITLFFYFDAPSAVKDWWTGASVIDELGVERRRGQALLKRQVTSEAELTAFIEDVRAWKTKVIDIMKPHVPDHLCAEFEDTGAFLAADWLGSFNQTHSSWRISTDLKIKLLGKIIERLEKE